MESILKKIRVDVSSSLYLKDPFSSELGISIVREGSLMIQELGLEQFTFKKLAAKIGSAEAAVYRYFENKHKFLLYLNAWYWAWLEHNYVFVTANLIDPEERLSLAIRLMVEGPIYRQNDHLDPDLLRYIVVNESLKGYMTKEVDSEHESGIFSQVYKFSDRVTSLIREINPGYLYPKTLVSTLMESTLMQSFNSQHMPGMMTDLNSFIN
ncbi:MAG: TetR/AcrR family transcriptional regulator [Algoriphagus sp.]|nr:TetR/AcrR family transcriptional regulator [Algoriphagus sp.]